MPRPQEMQARFLYGADSAYVDYAAIDQDTRLDDHRIINQDAEDAYFGEEEEYDY